MGIGGCSARFRSPLDAPVSRLPGDLRCWVAGLSRTRRRTRFDRDGGVMFWPTHAVARMVGTHWPGCSGSRYLVALYEDVNDGERLRHDPAMRWIVGGKAAQRSAASPSQMGRFETQWLAAPKNFAALAGLSSQWVDLVHGRRPPRGIVLDMDSSVSPTHGEQEMSVWNGHYACTCYHPLFVFNQFGDLERCALRAGNVHSADGWDDVLKPVVARYRGKVSRINFRADAAFAMPEVYEFLEAERIKYAIRLPANQVLQSRIGYLLTRPVGRPPHHVRRTGRLSR